MCLNGKREIRQSQRVIDYGHWNVGADLYPASSAVAILFSQTPRSDL